MVKKIDGVSFSDLVDICDAKGIEVEQDDNRDTLIEKLKPVKKPKE